MSHLLLAAAESGSSLDGETILGAIVVLALVLIAIWWAHR